MQKMGRYKNFELSEFVKSAKATARGIDNTPSFEVVDHLEELVDTILQPLRDAWGKPLLVTSGYRCPALNKAVGGAATSAHLYGYAADVQVSRPQDLDKFIAFAENWLRRNNVAFDQSISEASEDARWWHIGLRNSKGAQRRQFLALKKA